MSRWVPSWANMLHYPILKKVIILSTYVVLTWPLTSPHRNWKPKAMHVFLIKKWDFMFSSIDNAVIQHFLYMQEFWILHLLWIIVLQSDKFEEWSRKKEGFCIRYDTHRPLEDVCLMAWWNCHLCRDQSQSCSFNWSIQRATCSGGSCVWYSLAWGCWTHRFITGGWGEPISSLPLGKSKPMCWQPDMLISQGLQTCGQPCFYSRSWATLVPMPTVSWLSVWGLG